MNRLLPLLLVTAALAPMSFAAPIQATKAAPTVAILPILHQSGEKWEDLKKRQIEKSNEFLNDELGKRGFEITNADVVRRLLESEKIDMTDEENQKRSVLFDLGKKLKVDYILFAVITGTDQKKQERTFYKDTEGSADVKIWFLDVRGEKPILSAKVVTGRSGGNRIFSDGKGSQRQIQAAANALRDGLNDFFKGYPVVKKK